MTKARTLADNFAADINGITAGTGITGGGTSGTVTITNDMATAINAKGDLVVGTGADAYARLAVASTAGYLLSVDSAEATGLKWAAPAGGGKVLQVVNANTTTETAITSASMTDTGITATITPTLATSKIAIFISANTAIQEGGQTDIFASAELLRGASQIQDWEQANGFWQRIGGASGTLRLQGNHAVVYLDSPATTSATTYKLRARVNSPLTTIYFQRDSVPSNILLMEIGV